MSNEIEISHFPSHMMHQSNFTLNVNQQYFRFNQQVVPMNPNQTRIDTEYDNNNNLQPNKIISEKNRLVSDNNLAEGFPKQKSGGLEDGRKCKFYSDRVMMLEYSCLFFSFIGIVLSIFYHDADYNNQTAATNILLWIIFIGTIIQIAITYLRYQAILDLKKFQLLVDEDQTLKSQGMLYPLSYEVIFLLFQPYPFINDVSFETEDLYDQVSFSFKVNHLLSILILARVVILFRVILKSTKYFTTRAIRLGRMYGCDTGYVTIIKCLFKDYPLGLFTFVFFFQIFYFAYALRIAERFYLTEIIQKTPYSSLYQFRIVSQLYVVRCNNNDNSGLWYGQQNHYFLGDYFPRTIIGRFLVIFIAVWGTFTVSMLVVVFTSTFGLDSLERRALTVLKCLEQKVALQDKAAFIITLIAKLQIIDKNSSRDSKQGYKLLDSGFQAENRVKLKEYTTSFKSINRNLRMLYEKDDFSEQMARMFEQLKEDLKSLVDNQLRLKKFIEKQFDQTVNENVKKFVLEKLKQEDLQ